MKIHVLFFLLICGIHEMNSLRAQVLSLNGTALTASGGAPSNCTAGGYKTLNSASVSGNCVTFTTGSFQNGAIWACSGINLNQSFKLTFTANFGTNSAAGDGIAFLLQTEGVPQVIGGRGGGIGYAQGDGGGCQGGTCPITPSVAIEFDTWNNIPDGLNDLVCNHSSIQTNGIMTAGNTLAGPACLISGGTSVIDGLDHTICITWDPAVNQYRVSFDGAQIISYNGNIRTAFADPTNVFWGFTSASGGGAQTQRICSANMLTNIPSPSCLCTPPIATASPNPQTICSANPTGVTLSSSISGTTYAWATTANANITGESTSGGTGAMITDVLTNTTNTSQSVTYTVTPTASGCTGTAITVPVTVNPAPAITNMTAAICSTNSFTLAPANGTNGIVPAGTTYSWGAPVVTGGVTGGVAGSGASITGTLTNPTNTAQTATYTVTPTSGSCVGATFTVTVTVNPVPAVTNMTATICSTSSFTSTPANATNGVVPAGTTYTWSVPVVTGGVTGGVAGSGASITGTLTNPTNTAQTATYTVTPTSGSCPGATFTVTVTVNPRPAITNMTAAICSANSFTSTPANGTNGVVPAGTTYSWGVPVVTGGVTGGAAGSGASITGTLTNPTNTVQTATYTVTPTAGSCPGATFTVTVTVNPVPAVTNMTATICGSGSFTSTPANGTNGVVPAGTTYSWGVPVVTGGVTAGAAGSGGSITGTLTNPTNAAQTATYTVTPTSGSCPWSTFTVTVTLNPVPAVTNMTAAICSTNSFTSTPANGTNGVVPAGTSYSWGTTVVTGGVTGGAASSGASITGTLTNPTNTAQTATYTVTPTAGSCPGAAFTVTVTVNPVPAVTNMTAAICSTNSFTSTPANGTNGIVPAGTTYSWGVPVVTGGVTGGAAGSGGSITGTLTNPTNATQTATYTVTPTSGSCPGSTYTVTVTLNPVPAVTNMTAAICSTNSFTSTPANGTNGVVPAGTTYSWGAPLVTGGVTGGAAGSGASITGTLTNPTNTAQTATYTVTPTAESCPGATFTVTVTVNPAPAVTNMTATICSTGSFTSTPANGTNGIIVAGTTYSWGAPVVTGGVTGGASGSGASITGTLTNPTNTAQTATYTVTPTSGSCVGATFTVTVTVNPRPAITNMTATICSTNSFTSTPANGTNGVVPAGTTYSWGAPVVTGGITGGVAGSGASITGTLTNPTTAVQTATYTVTPGSGACSGAAFTVTVSVNPVPNVTTAVTNPSACGLSDGSITLSGLNPSTGYTLSYSDDGTPVGPTAITSTAGGTYVIPGLNAGGYSNIIVTFGGCNSAPASVSLSDPSSPVFTVSLLTNPTTCGGTQGSIHVEGTGTLSPSTLYSLTYTDNGASVGPVSITTDGNGDYDITGLNAGSYTSFVLNLAGCTGSQPGPVTLVDPTPPTATAGTTTPTICDGATINLTGNTVPGATYSWSGPNSFTSISEDPTIGSATTVASGTYTLTITLNNCVSLPSTVNVTVNATPVLNIIDPASVCSPATVNITAPAVTAGSANVGTLTYWTDAGATSSLATPSAVATSNTYYIQATNAGCTDIAPVSVTVVITPDVVTNNPAAVCSPLTVDLTAPAVTAGSSNLGALTYWTDAGATNALATPGAVTTSGTYYIQSGISGCTDIASVVVTVNQTPNLIITDPAAVCSPATVNITAPAVTVGSTSVGTLTYWTDAAATSSLTNPFSVSVSNTYYIQATNAGCTNIQPVVATINATPTFTLAGTDPSLCNLSDGSITISGLTASTNYSVGYSDDGTAVAAAPYTSAAAGTITITGLNAGAYNNFSVTITSSGCTGTSATTITLINPGAPVITDLADQTVCDTYTLPAITITGVAATQGYYTAQNGGGVQLAVGSSVTSTQTIYIYAVNGTCTDEETVLITVNNTPAITVTDPAAVCTPATVDITAAAVTAGSTNLGTMTYWSDAAATVAVSSPSAITTSGTYYIQSANGACKDIEPVTVTVNQTPVLAITNPSAVCTPLTVDITAAAVTAGSTNASNLTYWNDAAATSSLATPSAIATSNTYYIQATNAGCTDVAPVTVVVNATPAQPIAGTDSTYCSNWDLANMTASGSGGSFSWYTDPSLNPGSFFGSGEQILPQAINGTVTYYVIETLNGCEGPYSAVEITTVDCAIIIPTAYTPDGDGVNDTWEIIDLDNVYPKNIVTIFNRWGNVVYQSEEGNYSAKPWDGTYRDEALPVASYYFVIDFNEKEVKPRTGTVAIILNK